MCVCLCTGVAWIKYVSAHARILFRLYFIMGKRILSKFKIHTSETDPIPKINVFSVSEQNK